MIALHSDTAGRPRVRTTVGVRIGWRLSGEMKRFVREQLERGPFLAGFDAGIHLLADICLDADRVLVVRVEEP